MPGFSLTLLLLPGESDANAPDTNLLLSLLDEPAAVPGWKWTAGTAPSDSIITPQATAAATTRGDSARLKASSPQEFLAAIQRATDALIREEPEITRMDNIAGDGDCGLTLKSGAECTCTRSWRQDHAAHALPSLLSVLSRPGRRQERQDHARQCRRLHGRDLQSRRGANGRHKRRHLLVSAPSTPSGTPASSDYHHTSIFFSALAQSLQANAPSGGGVVDGALWSTSLTGALERLYTYTRARPPSRTLVDPLEAFVTTLAHTHADLGAAAKAAADAAVATRDLAAKAGRSAYVEGDRLRQEQVPDPGAWGVKAIVEGLLGARS
jgi:triose/dihydroxyacetone kinase / FAD-AMP lyase (cyclizing)